MNRTTQLVGFVLLSSLAWAKTETNFTESCRRLREELQEQKVKVGQLSLDRDLEGYLRFVAKHGDVYGNELSPAEAENIVRRMIKQKDTNMLRERVRDDVEMEMYSNESSRPEFYETRYAVGSANVRSVHPSQKGNWEKVQKEIDDVYLVLQSTSYAPNLKSGDKEEFHRWVRRYATPHALIQLRLTGQMNVRDCVRRAFRDLYYDSFARENESFKWLKRIHQATGGDFNKRLSYLLPAYDQP